MTVKPELIRTPNGTQLPAVRTNYALVVAGDWWWTMLLGRLQGVLLTPGLGGVVEARRLYERLMTMQTRQ